MTALVTSVLVLALAWENCGRGEFCIAPLEGGYGGTYHFDGSDPNLLNDPFDGHGAHLVVGRNAFSVRNRGGRDVLIFTRVRWRGTPACVRRGTSVTLQPGWLNHVYSYKWAECYSHP